MKQFEYKIEVIDTLDVNLKTFLNIQGREGWELVAIPPKHQYIVMMLVFKREITV